MMPVYSTFYYGFQITTDNFQIDFDDTGSEVTAEVDTGSYTPEELAEAVESAMNAVGDQTYTVAFNRSTRKFTISAASNFELLTNSGTHAGSTPWEIMGFSEAADKTGTNTYTGESAGGSQYTPPFPLQNLTLPEDWIEDVDSSINESSSGEIEAISFGERQFTEFEVKYISDRLHGSTLIRESATNKADFQDFIAYCRTKGKLQFMPDESDVNDYYPVILETTPQSSKGTGFKLKEMNDIGLPGFFETGNLKWRVVEESA